MKNMLRYGIVSLFFFVALVLSNSYFNFNEAIAHGYNDIKSYLFISESIIGDTNYLPQAKYHLERWPIHFFVGFITYNTGFELLYVYRFFVLLIIIITFFSISNLKCSSKNKIAILSLLVFNPYTFRTYLASPVMLSDCIFFYSIVLLFCSISWKNFIYFNISVLLSIISKQTAIMILPILLLLFIRDKISKKYLISSLIILVFGFLTLNLSTNFMYGKSEDSYILQHSMGIFFWLFDNPKFSEFLPFIGRYTFLLFTVLPYILIILLNIKSRTDLLYLFGFIFLHLQPILAGPLVTTGNIQRLSSLSIPFLISPITKIKMNNNLLLSLVFFSFITSFHHNSSILDLFEIGKYIFGWAVISLNIFFIFFAFKYFKTK